MYRLQFTLLQGRVKTKHTRCWPLLLQFTLPYRERRYTKNWDLPLWILQFTLPYRERHSPDCNGTKAIDYNSRSRIGSALIAKLLIYYFRYYNSHSHIGSAAILGFNSGSISELQFTLPYRERPVHQILHKYSFYFNSRSRIGSVGNI